MLLDIAMTCLSWIMTVPCPWHTYRDAVTLPLHFRSLVDRPEQINLKGLVMRQQRWFWTRPEFLNQPPLYLKAACFEIIPKSQGHRSLFCDSCPVQHPGPQEQTDCFLVFWEAPARHRSNGKPRCWQLENYGPFVLVSWLAHLQTTLQKKMKKSKSAVSFCHIWAHTRAQLLNNYKRSGCAVQGSRQSSVTTSRITGYRLWAKRLFGCCDQFWRKNREYEAQLHLYLLGPWGVHVWHPAWPIVWLVCIRLDESMELTLTGHQHCTPSLYSAILARGCR